MCGLTGFWVPNKGWSLEKLKGSILSMNAALIHRGPDDQGDWIDPLNGLAMGHRRLSVQDLSSEGHQPMVSASGRYMVTYNGELYNNQWC